MKTIKKVLAAVLLLALVSIFLSGCNTMGGLGKDIERGGEKIQDAAD